MPLEHLPLLGKLFPADETHFPPGYRFSLTINDALMTSKDGTSHLLGLGEFCAMYLLVWSNACWPAALPTEADIKNQELSFPWLGLMPADLRSHVIGETEKSTLITAFRVGELSGPVLENVLNRTSQTVGPDKERRPRGEEGSTKSTS